MTTNTTTSLLVLLTTALTATDSGPQVVGIEFDVEKYRVAGDVPMSVRNLQNLYGSLANEHNALLSEAKKEGVVPTASTLEDLRNKIACVKDLQWKLLRDTFPLPNDAKGLAILNDWQVGFELKSEEELALDAVADFVGLTASAVDKFFEIINRKRA